MRAIVSEGSTELPEMTEKRWLVAGVDPHGDRQSLGRAASAADGT